MVSALHSCRQSLATCQSKRETELWRGRIPWEHGSLGRRISVISAQECLKSTFNCGGQDASAPREIHTLTRVQLHLVLWVVRLSGSERRVKRRRSGVRGGDCSR